MTLNYNNPILLMHLHSADPVTSIYRLNLLLTFCVVSAALSKGYIYGLNVPC